MPIIKIYVDNIRSPQCFTDKDEYVAALKVQALYRTALRKFISCQRELAEYTSTNNLVDIFDNPVCIAAIITEMSLLAEIMCGIQSNIRGPNDYCSTALFRGATKILTQNNIKLNARNPYFNGFINDVYLYLKNTYNRSLCGVTGTTSAHVKLYNTYLPLLKMILQKRKRVLSGVDDILLRFVNFNSEKTHFRIKFDVSVAKEYFASGYPCPAMMPPTFPYNTDPTMALLNEIMHLSGVATFRFSSVAGYVSKPYKVKDMMPTFNFSVKNKLLSPTDFATIEKLQSQCQVLGKLANKQVTPKQRVQMIYDEMGIPVPGKRE